MKLISLVFLFLFASCCFEDCMDDDSFVFVLKGPDGTELFTGLNPPYSIDKLELTTLEIGTKGTAHYVYQEADRLTTYLNYRHPSIIISIDSQPRDTITFDYNVTNDRCCGKGSTITKVYHDGQEINYGHEPVEIIVD